MFRVTARNVVGDSATSDQFSAMTATLPGTTGTPYWSDSTETQITLTWDEPVDTGGDPIDDYEVFWDEGLGGSFVSLGLTGGSRTFTTMDGLTTGTMYKFKAKAVNFIGAGPESAIGVIIMAAPPEPPTSISQSIATESSIKLSWTSHYDGGSVIQDYQVYEAEIL